MLPNCDCKTFACAVKALRKHFKLADKEELGGLNFTIKCKVWMSQLSNWE